MRHARSEALDHLEPLLQQLRRRPDLVEKKRGTFYKKSRAFAHFHEDPQGLFADLRLSGEAFERFRVETPQEQEAFLVRVDQRDPSTKA